MSDSAETTIGQKIAQFFFELHPQFPLPEGIEIMHPYLKADVRVATSTFYNKYFGDHQPRVLMLGINPGRMGAGITGVPFTDPVLLSEKCEINHSLQGRRELSGAFIYEMAEAYGGTQAFYKDFLLSSICPLGFISKGKNVNFYDTKALQYAALPFIISSVFTQKELTGNREVCLCLGQGKNYQFLNKLNEEHHFFKKIFPLPHPRWVLQYRRKRKDEFLQLYLDKMKEAVSLAKQD